METENTKMRSELGLAPLTFWNSPLLFLNLIGDDIANITCSLNYINLMEITDIHLEILCKLTEMRTFSLSNWI